MSSLASCCGQSSGCRCSVQAATPDACDPITVNVAGVGSNTNPYLIGAILDLAKIFDFTDPCLGLTTDTVGGCTKVVSACNYRFI